MDSIYLRESRTKKPRKVDLGERVAGGAAGDIFRLKRLRKKLAKIYNREEDRELYAPKIAAMLDSSPKAAVRTINGRKFCSLAWPLGVLESSAGDFLGFTMPEVDLGTSVSLERLMQKRMRAVSGLPEFYGGRISVAYNLAACIETLHALEHYVIDLKPVNCRVYPENMLIAVLDCDGFSVYSKSEKRFPASQFTPEYIAPEALGEKPETLGEQQDLFALSVIIFKLLNNGLHPFQCRIVGGRKAAGTLQQMVDQGCYAYGIKLSQDYRPAQQSVHEYLPVTLRGLFDRAFSQRSADRPSAAEWRTALRKYIDPKDGNVFRCENKSDEHAHFGLGCGWCALEESNRERASGSKSSRKTVSLKNQRRSHHTGQQKPMPSVSSTASSRFSSSTKLILSAILTLCVLGTVLDFIWGDEETVFDVAESDLPGPVNRIAFARQNVEVRQVPALSSKIIDRLEKGTEVVVLSRMKGASVFGDTSWFEVRYQATRTNSSGKVGKMAVEGYVSSQYVLVSNLIPRG